MPSRPASRLFVHTPHFLRPIAFVNCDDLAADTMALLHGWDAQISRTAPSRKKPLATITRLRKFFRWEGDRLPSARDWPADPPSSAFSALLDIHYEWSDWFVRENPDHLCLHAGAVEIGGSGIVFPSDQRAGKSLLTVQFASRGYCIFGDDVVGLCPRGARMMSVGLAPRLRLPLPASAGTELLDYVAARRGPASPRYQFLSMPAIEFAPLGTTAPIHAFVLLERRESGEAMLSPARPGETLNQLIRKNFAEDVPVVTIFNRLKRLTRLVPSYRLSYASGADAIALLTQKFSKS